MTNTRACGTCRHLDHRLLPNGTAWCWQYYYGRRPDEVAPDCTDAERANGQAPPGQLRYQGETR